MEGRKMADWFGREWEDEFMWDSAGFCFQYQCGF